jgi:tRNA isopentenyl-2-thiomethyl-A-37 hydroxylase MiaE
MDEVLTRKMFKNRYFKTLKPTIKHFQEGGLGSLSPKEKAIYAATLAAPLLQAKGKGLAPALEALGEGVGKLPATILSVEKEKGTGVRTLTANELKSYNLPPGTIAQIKADGTISVVSKPSAEQTKTVQGSKRVRTILSRIADDYQKLDKPVGPLSYRTIAPFTKAAGTQYAKDFAQMKSRIQQATSFVTQAISGAAVSEQEAERITKLIPQLKDTEATFEAKLTALDSYFADAIAIANDNNADFSTALEIMENSGRGADNYLNLEEAVSIKKIDGGYDVSSN